MEKKMVDKTQENIWKQNIELAEILTSAYITIMKVDLESGMVSILKEDNATDVKNTQILWDCLLEKHGQKQLYWADNEQMQNISLEQLNEYYDRNNTIFPIELRSFSKNETYNWIKVTADIVPSEKRELLIMSQIINHDHIMKKIIDMFVYQNFDYFVLLDSNNNSYTMFNGKPDKPLPPKVGDDYEAEVKRYNHKHVVPEEVETVTANMSIAHVLSMLETKECYAFNTGSFAADGKYRRTRIQFTYYDKVAGLILLTRSDITQLHKEEQEKERKLSLALREAKLDPMTELYNKKAMQELVGSALNSQYRAQAAVLFIDIDNFKIVNDTLGHQKGDELICNIGHLLTRLASKDGIAGRIGGDEFLLFLSAVENTKQITEYANVICNTLKNKQELGDLPVSCSVGIAVYPRDGTEYEQLLYKADQALYDAKRHGKSKYAFYSMELDEESQRLYYKREQKEVTMF